MLVAVQGGFAGFSYHGFEGCSADSGVLVSKVVADYALDIPQSSWR